MSSALLSLSIYKNSATLEKKFNFYEVNLNWNSLLVVFCSFVSIVTRSPISYRGGVANIVPVISQVIQCLKWTDWVHWFCAGVKPGKDNIFVLIANNNVDNCYLIYMYTDLSISLAVCSKIFCKLPKIICIIKIITYSVAQYD